MGAFTVYGVSRSMCIEMARKAVETAVQIPGTSSFRKESWRHLDEDEWDASVERYADYLFERGRIQRIAPGFDAPQFAQRWLNMGLAAKAIREDSAVYALVETGEIDPKTKKKIVEWRPYQPAFAA